MAYYTGQANSHAELATALQSACVAEGWTLTGTILSKGAAYVQVEAIAGDSNLPASLKLTGGTGESGGTLVNPSAVTPRMGRGHKNAAADTWPMVYHIHIHTDPDEVYFIANWSVDFWRWLAFGVSCVPGLAGTGLWITANAQYQYNSGYMDSPTSYSYTMGVDYGGSGPGYYSYYRNAGPFWLTFPRDTSGTVAAYGKYYQDAIHTGLNSLGASGWGGVPTAAGANAPGSMDAIKFCRPHMARLPNTWNSETILLPIHVYEWTASNKCQMVLDVRHARYLRLDNYQPGDVITLGSDKWKVYPFWRKSSAERDCGSNKEHTGTFGWAIRYDGA